jgi:iron complex transport system permease protein
MKIKAIWLIIISAVLLFVITVVMLTIGTAQVPFHVVVSVMTEQLLGIDNQHVTAAQQMIVGKIRWQRVALAIVVGSGLAVSGACYQTMFKNPLADPFILGVSSGAALGAALSMVTHHTQYIILFAFAGGVVSLSLVYLFGQRSMYIRPERLLLAGITCSSMLTAILQSVMALNSQNMNMIVFWLMGSLTNNGENLNIVAAVVAVGLVVAMIYARDLDVIALGDETAKSLGVNVDKVKLILMASTTLMTAAAVSMSGIIGFIGLIVPHMVRKTVGPEHQVLLLLSAIWGALFLLLADGLTRLNPLLAGIPVGVVTALIGSPFFLYILYTTSKRS